MATNFKIMINKLQKACNEKFDAKLLYNKTQIYSEKSDKTVTFLSIKKATLDPKTGKIKNVELFNTTSELQVVKFLRDYWYELNGWEIEKDDEEWEEQKRKYQERKAKGITPDRW